MLLGLESSAQRANRLLILGSTPEFAAVLIQTLESYFAQFTFEVLDRLNIAEQNRSTDFWKAAIIDHQMGDALIRLSLQQLWMHDRDLPIILLVDHLTEEQVAQYFKMGVSDCVVRSRLSGLAALVDTAINQAMQRRVQRQEVEQTRRLLEECIEELQQERQKVLEANRARADFLATMSHELRTPMTGILGFSSLLAKQIFGPLNEKQQQYVTGIASCGQQLLELINDLLDLARVDANQEELVIQPLNVAEICQNCLFLIQAKAYSKGLTVESQIDPQTTICFADQRRLMQILLNLLSNAVKFTETGSITLQVLSTNYQVQFRVIDTGIGIAEADFPLLFEPFRQVDSGLNRRYEGTGLGLTLAYKLARLHGGDIAVESLLGQGSCFTLSLPIPGE